MTDIHGIPILPGDVLRTAHYLRRPHRRMMYLYHVAVLTDGHLEAVPARELGAKRDGGRCWILENNSFEIVEGYGPGPNDDFLDRKKVKK